jgi:hypothetical protein
MPTNKLDQEYVPYQGGLTIEEFIDRVSSELTISCALPKSLQNIRQIIEARAKPWFYRTYQNAVQKIYFLIRKEAFSRMNLLSITMLTFLVKYNQ